ncbi:MAG: hypothetical protein KDK36_05830 [Leptospiraceae bacterium]|nr:hypothetical protein [Leptospiraceae bacterium]
MKRSILIFILFLHFCTNFSTKKTTPVPPILVSLKTIPTGYLLTFRGSNPEIFFAGYRLYTGTSESEARNPSDLNAGADCSSINLLPNLPLEYSIEISSTAGDLATVEEGDNPNRVCKIVTTLTAGQYISVRALILSFQIGSQSFNISAPSNALIVP